MRKHALLPSLVDAMLGRCRRSLSVCAVLSSVGLGTSKLRAQEIAPTLLSYRAPEGCPEVADFQRSVQRRSAHVRFVDEGSHDRELSIVLRKDGDLTNGELRLIERDGSLRQRSVRFTSCAEAVEGLALITLVSLDPKALLEPEKPAEPAPTPAPVPKVEGPRVSAPPRLVAVAPESRTEVALGGQFNAAFRALPGSALGGSLFVDVASTSPSWFAPLLRVAIGHVQRRGLSSNETGEAEANFSLTLATMSACPLRVAGGAFTLRPCAFVSGGLLRAWGSNTTDLEPQSRPYGAWGGSLLAFARASQTTDIVADIAAGPTVFSDRFGFDQELIWKTPALYLSSGVGLRFVFR